MKVQRLKIESFRGIDNLTLDFDPNVNVLLGINGVGKSSIVDALAIVLSRFIEWVGASPEKDVRDPQDSDITNSCQQLRLDITLASSHIHWSVLKVLGKPAQEEGIEQALSKAHTIRRRLEGRSTQAGSIPLSIYYSVNRAVNSVPLEVFDSNTYQKNTLYPFDQLAAYSEALSNKKARFEDFFRWFRNREDIENELRLNNDPRYFDPQLQAVRSSIPAFLENFSNLRVRRSPLRMTVQKHDQELVVNQLSDGEKCLLAMVGDLARRLAIANPGLTDPLQGEGVVLIDEIELHLHPQWQRKIIPCLTNTFPNCQFIVTTHSPQVISHVEADNIYILKSTAEGVKALRPEYSFGRDTNTILEDLMDVPSRPQEIQDQLQELFRLIEAGDLEAARRRVEELAIAIRPDDAELVGARAAIRRKEILGR